MRRSLLSLALLGALIGSGELAAQEIYRTGRGTTRLDARLDEILEAGRYRALTRDTLIARSDTLAGPVLALGNRLVIEGTVLGPLAIVDANVYARPGALIIGDVINIGGGFYRSEQARITGSVDDEPLAPYHVERAGDRITIVGDTEHRVLRPDLEVPRANRVDGLRPYLGLTVASPPVGAFSLEVTPWAAYGFARDDFEDRVQGGVELTLRRRLNALSVGLEQTTASNDAWNRSDLMNTASFLWNGRDFRDYYEAERIFVSLSRELVRGQHLALWSLRAQRERATSLVSADPWVLFEPDSFRFNPPIDEGRIQSGIMYLIGDWTGRLTAAEYDGRIEVGQADVETGDWGFGAFFLSGLWAMRALANHTLALEGYLQGPLGADSLPRQRWSILGGSGTLYTFRIGRFRGDRVVFVKTSYTIPLGGLIRIPYLGAPNVEVFDHIGMAWTHGEDRAFEQNVGVKVAFPWFYARVVANTENLGGARYSLGVSIRRRPYPWERRSEVRARFR
jgi:hypothetical protein